MKTYTCVIADDHAIVRSGLRAALSAPGLVEPAGLSVLAEAANGLECIAALRQHRPDLLMLDVQMPMAGGVEVVLEARRWSPETRIVVLTGISAVGKLAELISIGVEGLFSKATENDELYAALPLILRGGRQISGHVTKLLEDQPEGDGDTLTDRERQVLNFIAAGRSNKEMAEILGISAKTVDRHRTSLMQKLGVHSVAQLIAYALRSGLIDPSAEL